MKKAYAKRYWYLFFNNRDDKHFMQIFRKERNAQTYFTRTITE